MLGILVITSIALWTIGLIPFVGTIIKAIMIVLGLGMITSNLFLKEKNADTPKKEISENEAN